MKPISVQCGGCGATLVRDRVLAKVRHYPNGGVTAYTKYYCITVDCGTEVVIEEDE